MTFVDELPVVCFFAFLRFTWTTRKRDGGRNHRHDGPALLGGRHRQPQPGNILHHPGPDALLCGLANCQNRYTGADGRPENCRPVQGHADSHLWPPVGPQCPSSLTGKHTRPPLLG